MIFKILQAHYFAQFYGQNLNTTLTIVIKTEAFLLSNPSSH